MHEKDAWPALPFPAWEKTCDTLHLWTQIVGKSRLDLAPMQNHWWQATLYVTAAGLGTSPIPAGGGAFEVEFDFLEHRLVVRQSDGGHRALPLESRSVADFYRAYLDALRSLGLPAEIRHPSPNEVATPIRFDADTVHATYDPEAAGRFGRALTRVDRVLKE